MTSPDLAPTPAGPTTIVPDDTWALVADNVAGRPLPTLLRRRQQRWAALAVLLVLAAVGGALLAGSGSKALVWVGSNDRSGWAGVVGSVLVAGALVAWAVGWIRMVRTDGFPRPGSNPTAGVRQRQRRELERMARDVSPWPPARVHLVREVADHRLQQSATTIAVFPGLMLLWIGNAFLQTWSVLSVGQLVAAMSFGILLFCTVRWRRQWRALLDRTEPRVRTEPRAGEVATTPEPAPDPDR